MAGSRPPGEYLAKPWRRRRDVSIRSDGGGSVRRFRPRRYPMTNRKRRITRRRLRTDSDGRQRIAAGAFPTDALDGLGLIVERLVGRPGLVALVPELATTLASLLEDQDQAAEGQPPAEASALEQEPLVRLCIAKPLGMHHPGTRGYRHRAPRSGELPENTRAEVRRSVVSSFKPLEVMPNLIRFLRRARAMVKGITRLFG